MGITNLPRVEAALRDAGAILDSTNNHAKYRLPNGARFTIAKTASDHCAEENALHDLRRLLGATSTIGRIGERREHKRFKPSSRASDVEAATPEDLKAYFHPPREEGDKRRPFLAPLPEDSLTHFSHSASSALGRLPTPLNTRSIARRDHRPAHGKVVSLSPLAQEVLSLMAIFGEDPSPFRKLSITEMNQSLEALYPRMNQLKFEKAIEDITKKMELELAELPEVKKLRLQMEDEFRARMNKLSTVVKERGRFEEALHALKVVKGLDYDWTKVTPTTGPLTPARRAYNKTQAPGERKSRVRVYPQGTAMREWIQSLKEGDKVTTKIALEFVPAITYGSARDIMNSSPLMKPLGKTGVELNWERLPNPSKEN